MAGRDARWALHNAVRRYCADRLAEAERREALWTVGRGLWFNRKNEWLGMSRPRWEARQRAWLRRTVGGDWSAPDALEALLPLADEPPARNWPTRAFLSQLLVEIERGEPGDFRDEAEARGYLLEAGRRLRVWRSYASGGG